MKIEDEDRTGGAKWYTVTEAKEGVNKDGNQNRVQNRNEHDGQYRSKKGKGAFRKEISVQMHG